MDVDDSDLLALVRSKCGLDGWCEVPYHEAVRHREALAGWRGSGFADVVSRGRFVKVRLRFEEIRLDLEAPQQAYGSDPEVHRALSRARAGGWTRMRVAGGSLEACRPPADWGLGSELIGLRKSLSVVREVTDAGPLIRRSGVGLRAVAISLIPPEDASSALAREALASMLDPADSSRRVVDRFVEDVPGLRAALDPGADIVYIVAHGHEGAGLGPSSDPHTAWLTPTSLGEVMRQFGVQVAFLRACEQDSDRRTALAPSLSRQGVGLVVSFIGSPRVGASGDPMAAFHAIVLDLIQHKVPVDFAVPGTRVSHLHTGGEGVLTATMHPAFNGVL